MESGRHTVNTIVTSENATEVLAPHSYWGVNGGGRAESGREGSGRQRCEPRKYTRSSGEDRGG